MPNRPTRATRTRLCRAGALACLIALALVAAPETQAQPKAGAAPVEGAGASGTRSLAETLRAVVKVRARALPNARSVATLGAQREGSGTRIAPSGLVLTIGYLVVEAETVEIEDAGGRSIPASVVANDYGTGFALLRPLLPLAAPALDLGRAAELAEGDDVLFAVHGGTEAATLASVVSRRRFAGYWEYMIEGAIFTAPARTDHSGAALLDRAGRLLGVGSLVVGDARGTRERSPGNMFVPVDLLEPILAELIAKGSSHASRRPWIGMSTQEVDGRLFVLRVQEDGPADRAEVRAGDIVLAVEGRPVTRLEELYRALWAVGEPGARIRLTLLQGVEVRQVSIESLDREDFVRPRQSL